MINSKKAVGHVEVILSFVIFLGFLIFIFFIFNPFDLISNTSLVDSVFLNMQEKLSVKTSSISININPGILDDKPCFRFMFNEIAKDMSCPLIGSNYESKNFIVKDKDGAIVNSQITPSGNHIDIEKANGDNKVFYTIYCSSEINNQNTVVGCNNDNRIDGEYALGIISEKNVFSYSKLNILKYDYETNYETIKNDFISEGSDFGFIVWNFNTNTELLKAGKPPERVKVDARTIPIDVSSEDGTIVKRTLTIITW